MQRPNTAKVSIYGVDLELFVNNRYIRQEDDNKQNHNGTLACMRNSDANEGARSRENSWAGRRD